MISLQHLRWLLDLFSAFLGVATKMHEWGPKNGVEGDMILYLKEEESKWQNDDTLFRC